jgi:hypothetical protein
LNGYKVSFSKTKNTSLANLKQTTNATKNSSLIIFMPIIVVSCLHLYQMSINFLLKSELNDFWFYFSPSFPIV